MSYQPPGAYQPTPGYGFVPPPTPPARRRRGLWISLIIVGAALVAAAAVLVTFMLLRPKPFEAVGVMSLEGYDSYVEGATAGECVGTSGYDDISEGTQVVVTDDSGNTVGVGELEAGFTSDDECEFVFHVTGIPAGKKFYEVEVGHRGGLQYTEKELRDGIGVSLGS